MIKHQIRHIHDMDSISTDEVIAGLEKWAYYYKSWQDNYDSRLLLKAVEIIEELRKKNE